MVKQDKLRCFISLNLSKNVIDKVVNIQKQIKNDKMFSGRLVEKDNLHLTLKFLGEIDSDKLNEVRKRLSEINFNQINLSFGEIGVFSKEDIRIVWIKLKGADELQKEIDNKLKGLFSIEKRFMSHITLFRVKKVYDKKRFFDHLEKIKFDKINFSVDNFYLIQSSLYEPGSAYSEIEKYNLKSFF